MTNLGERLNDTEAGGYDDMTKVGKVDDGDKFPELVGLVTWVVVSNIFYFHPGPWGNDPN